MPVSGQRSGAGLLALRRRALAQGDGDVLLLTVAQDGDHGAVAGVLGVFDPAPQVAVGRDGLAVDSDDDVAAREDGLTAELRAPRAGLDAGRLARPR